MFLKYGLPLLGGVALGAIGVLALSKANPKVKTFAVDIISRALDLKDIAMEREKEARKQVDNFLEDARQVSNARKSGKKAEA